MSERNEEFDQFIDETHPVITIGGIWFSPSKILFECDPVAYGVMLSDWESNYSLDDEDEEPLVCSAEDAYDSLSQQELREWYGRREEFIKQYNELNNL